MKKYSLLLITVICLTTSILAQIGNMVIPDGHSVGIEKMVLSADGKYLYTANEQKIIMWDTKLHKQMYSFDLGGEMSLTGSLHSFILSPDGNYVAASGYFGLKCFSTITGQLIYNIDGIHYSATFSADSKEIYFTGDRGIISTNLHTLSSKPVFECVKGTDCYEYSTFETFKNGLVLLRHRKGWQIADLDTKKIMFIDSSYNNVDNKKFLTVLNTNLIAREEKTGERNNLLHFYDAFSGKEIFSREVKRDWSILPSVDGNSFLLNSKIYDQPLELIDAKNAGTTLRKIDMNDETGFIYVGFVSANSERIYYTSIEEVMEMDLQTQKVSLNFKRETINFRTYEYNKDRQEFRTVSDETHYVAVDFNRMVVNKNVALIEREFNNRDISYSPTGDTVSIIDNKNAFFYDIKSRKQTPISSALLGDITFEVGQKPNILFGREGKFAYAIKNVPVNNDDAQTVYQINLATNTNKKIANFRYILEIDISQDMIAGYDLTPTGFVVKAWQLSTGKQVFTKILPRTQDETKLFGARFIDGISKIAILRNGLQIFNMTDGKLLQNRKLTWGGFFTLSHNAAFVANNYGDGNLQVMDSAFQTLYDIKPHIASIQQVYFSPDDSLIYTAGYDNTIKVFRTTSGELLGTMYIFRDSKDYVFIHPTGRFDGTPEGMTKLYYLKDRKVITLDKIYEKFYTPNLYQRLVNGEVFAPIDIKINGTPIVSISYAEAARNLEVEDDMPTYQNKTGFADIVVSATAEDDAIDEIRLFHNGKIVTLTTRNLIVEDDKGASQTKNYQLTLLPGSNNIRAIALNTQRTESEPDEIAVNFSEAGNSSPAVIKPVSNEGVIVSEISKNATLYLVVVGINAYQNPAMSLNYALADATAFKTEIEKDAQTVIKSTKTYFVTDADASKDGILTAFNQVKQNAKAQDVFIFYYAGHGVIGKDKEFYLVPKDVSDLKNVQAELESKGIPAKLLQQYAVEIQAQKQLFILDACQSAGAFDEMLSASGEQQKSIAVVSRSTGTHWMAASGAQQFANEFSQLGHGAFTYVLLQALNGSAANNKMITVNGLKNYIQLEVPALMKKYSGTLQYPASYGFGNDFPVEVMK